MRIAGGYLIAIEGVDAVGKNTQTDLLLKSLRKRRISSVRLSFPDYNTPIGQEIRLFLSGRRAYPPELQHLLFAANRWEKSDRIRSLLRAGTIVVVDRYTPSNLAYGIANGLDVGWLDNLENGLPLADLVLVLYAPTAATSSRRPRHSKDTYEKSLTLQLRAQKAYRRLANKRGWKLLDAKGAVGEIQEDVIKTVTDALRRERAALI